MEQMTIDDFLNDDNVATISTMEVPKGEQVESVDLHSLSKEELISIIDVKDNATKNYENKIESLKEVHQKELSDMTEYYGGKIKELSNLVQYYERKIKVLKDIINIETGGER